MNSNLMQKESKAFAGRLTSECGSEDSKCQVRLAYKLALSRAPRAEEFEMAEDFFAKGGRLPDFCLAMMNRNELVYLP
jgi:hypothetical protein